MSVNNDTDTSWPAKGPEVETYPDTPGSMVETWPSNHSQDGDSSYPDGGGLSGDGSYPDANRTPSDTWPGR